MTLSEWKERYVWLKRAQECNVRSLAPPITRFCKTFGACGVAEFQKALAREYLESLYASGLAPNSIRTALSVLHAFFAEAVAHELRPDNPFAGLKKPKPVLRENYLGDADIARLLGAAFGDALMERLLIVALDTGIRRAALLALDARDVRLDMGAIHKRREHAKGRKDRFIPMSPAVIAAVAALLEGQPPEAPLFRNPDGSRLRNHQLEYRWHRLARAAGLRDAHFHDLRHTFAFRYLKGGGSLRTLMELLDHSSSQTTMRYAHVSDEMLAEAVRGLPALPAPMAPPPVPRPARAKDSPFAEVAR